MLALVVSLIVVSAAMVVNGAPLEDGVGIVGGTKTTIEKHPFQVALYKDGEFYCGGSIINEKHIVTALHCVERWEASDFRVRVGITRLSEEQHSDEVFDVESISKFDTRFQISIYGDVAVLKLKKAITFGPKAQPIALVPENEDPRPGETLTITGWGYKSEHGDVVDELRQVQVPAVDRATCFEEYKHIWRKITDRMICAGVPGRDHCFGDSGGPVVNAKKQLVGIVSFAKGCARPKFPGVSTNVANPDINRFIIKHSEE